MRKLREFSCTFWRSSIRILELNHFLLFPIQNWHKPHSHTSKIQFSPPRHHLRSHRCCLSPKFKSQWQNTMHVHNSQCEDMFLQLYNFRSSPGHLGNKGWKALGFIFMNGKETPLNLYAHIWISFIKERTIYFITV